MNRSDQTCRPVLNLVLCPHSRISEALSPQNSVFLQVLAPRSCFQLGSYVWALWDQLSRLSKALPFALTELGSELRFPQRGHSRHQEHRCRRVTTLSQEPQLQKLLWRKQLWPKGSDSPH